MVKRSLEILTTIALAFFVFTSSCPADTIRKSVPAKRDGCSSCARKSAKTSSRTSRKNAKAANAPCHGKDYLDPKVAARYNKAVREMRRQGIKPKVTSLWRSSDHQALLHKCSTSSSCRRAHPGLYYALPPGNSLHEAGLAVDISGVAAGPRGKKRLTPRGKRIVAVMQKNGFNWRYRLKDPAHFEADPKKNGYRSARQAIKHTQSTCDVKLAKASKGAQQKKINGRVSVTRSTAKSQLSVRRAVAKTTRHTLKARA